MTMGYTDHGLRLLRRAEVQGRLGISRTTLYGRLDPASTRFDPEFPRPVRMGASVAFVEHELESYVQRLMSIRDGE